MSELRTSENLTISMSERRTLLSGSLKDGIYRISFTVADKPLLTPQACKAHPVNPILILEFKEEHGMQILADMVASMIDHKHKPTWEVVYAQVEEAP